MTDEYMTDDEQLEQVKRIVAENWLWVAGGIALGFALIFGYRYYDGYRNERALRAAAQFADLAAALEHNDAAKARQLGAGLIQTYPNSPYADQTKLALARLSIDEAKPADAIAPLTQVMNNSKDDELRHIARLRLARVLIDQGKPDDAIKTLAEDKPGTFAAQFHDVRGDAFYAKKDMRDAAAEYTAALAGADMGGVNPSLIQLKIVDLNEAAAAPAAAPTGAAPPAAAVSPAAAPLPTSTNKAKP